MLTEDQADVIEFLAAHSAHGTAAVERIDTHSAIVFLARACLQVEASRPVRLPRFLDG